MNNDDLFHEYCVRKGLCELKETQKPYNIKHDGITVLALMELARQDERKKIISKIEDRIEMKGFDLIHLNNAVIFVLEKLKKDILKEEEKDIIDCNCRCPKCNAPMPHANKICVFYGFTTPEIAEKMGLHRVTIQRYKTELKRRYKEKAKA